MLDDARFGRPARPQVIAVANQKGGVDKTMFCVSHPSHTFVYRRQSH
ncbi:ParA family protein [Actinomyces sp. B33]